MLELAAKPCVPEAIVKAVPSADTAPSAACALASALVNVAVPNEVSVNPPVRSPSTPAAELLRTVTLTAFVEAVRLFLAMMSKSRF